MSKAGDFRFRFVREVPHKDPGDLRVTYVDTGELWGTLDEISSDEDKELGEGIAVVKAICMIRIRGKVTLNNQDRLRQKDTGEKYWINGIKYDFRKNETFIYCNKKTLGAIK